MLHLGFRLAKRLAPGVALMVLGLVGCTAGVEPTHPTGNGGGGASGVGTGGSSNTGLGGFITTGTGGSSSTGTGGTLPVPPGCGDGINNQGGIEECDDGNTVAGDGCNGICHVEPNWTCPPAGSCMRKFTCGDGVINPGEVCDDGNTNDGDGCSANCTMQDGRYTCMAGKPCVLSSICGNKRVETGENCDDGNTKAGDGCSATCQLESGWVCTAPGSPCMMAPRCGDGIVQVAQGEVCDDGNITEGDGCSANCKVMGASCVCVPGMKCTCPQVVCGDGIIAGSEKCDDGNMNSGDGCSSTCTIERGYVCPLVKAPCVPDCGDGILTGNEPCDPGIAVEKNACSSTCRWNPGYACTGNPISECHTTKCGDGKKEGAEGCDDGNTLPYDGCSATCTPEPACPAGGTAGGCTGKCGDGIVLSGEACDDGNNLAGDGCSATCTLESGFMCTRPPLGDSIQVPAVYRDFSYHTPSDFEPGATGQMMIVPNLVNTMLGADGKPVRSSTAYTYIASAATFAQWYTDVAGVNKTYARTLTLWNNGNGGYVNRWGANGEQWPLTKMAYYCGNVGREQLDAMGNPIPCTSLDASSTDCQTLEAAGATQISCTKSGGNWVAVYQTGALDGTPAFFPIDDVPGAQLETRAANIPPPYDPNWGPEMPAKQHNFSFTTEIRYWFPYDSSKSYKLDFTGDDDVWMFVNKKLAVDIGGIHTPQNGTITISNANAATYGLTNGGVYEVEVFQAERQTTSSSFKLTLSGFNAGTSACGPVCGDHVVTPPEQCDNGTANNTGGYNKCTADCKLGPFCGDGMVTDSEQCDNGTNGDAYGAMSGCAPGCKLPARCGDKLVQTEYGEQCDDGTNSGGYGGCTNQCQRAGYCGDGKTQSPQEQCDDGANDGTYGHCGDPTMQLPNCMLGPRCGDGIVQDAYGEECEPTSSSDPNCTAACKKPGVCGDGVKTAPEECDYGAVQNDGSYGGCAPSCILAPHCGDAIKNGPEDCDDGVNDNSYGGCSPQCKFAAHCGDGMTNKPYEQCDDGVNNGPTGVCSTVCKFNVQ
jgi:fibro-slime domain-containing protein